MQDRYESDIPTEELPADTQRFQRTGNCCKEHRNHLHGIMQEDVRISAGASASADNTAPSRAAPPACASTAPALRPRNAGTPGGCNCDRYNDGAGRRDNDTHDRHGAPYGSSTPPRPHCTPARGSAPPRLPRIEASARAGPPRSPLSFPARSGASAPGLRVRGFR